MFYLTLPLALHVGRAREQCTWKARTHQAPSAPGVGGAAGIRTQSLQGLVKDGPSHVLISASHRVLCSTRSGGARPQRSGNIDPQGEALSQQTRTAHQRSSRFYQSVQQPDDRRQCGDRADSCPLASSEDEDFLHLAAHGGRTQSCVAEVTEDCKAPQSGLLINPRVNDHRGLLTPRLMGLGLHALCWVSRVQETGDTDPQGMSYSCPEKASWTMRRWQ